MHCRWGTWAPAGSCTRSPAKQEAPGHAAVLRRSGERRSRCYEAAPEPAPNGTADAKSKRGKQCWVALVVSVRISIVQAVGVNCEQASTKAMGRQLIPESGQSNGGKMNPNSHRWTKVNSSELWELFWLVVAIVSWSSAPRHALFVDRYVMYLC
jgi:hypothetical protein